MQADVWWLGALPYALFGAAVGSFLNLCIDRLPQDQSIITPSPRCESCGRSLALTDLVPIISFLALAGRCRYCGAVFSRRALLVEALATVTYAALWLWLGPSGQLVMATIFCSFLIVVAFIDVERHLVLNRLLLPVALIAVPSALLYGVSLQNSLLGGAVGLAVMFALYALSRGGLGAGDVKLAAVVGLFIGFPAIAVALFAASISGGIIAAILLATGRKGRRDPMPYALFICLGGAFGLAAGQQIVRWYLSML